jgi:hypothetical protein
MPRWIHIKGIITEPRERNGKTAHDECASGGKQAEWLNGFRLIRNLFMSAAILEVESLGQWFCGSRSLKIIDFHFDYGFWRRKGHAKPA